MLIRNKSVLIYLLFFFSGFSALIYEVVWLRKLELVFGTTNYAVSTVLAIFFTGLAVGSYLFGKLVDLERPGLALIARRTVLGKLLEVFLRRLPMKADSALIGNNPRSSSLLLYGFLELGIGIYAVLTPLIFNLISQIQAIIWQEFTPSYSNFSIVTFFLSSIGLLIPTILMGGTFPAAVAAARISTDKKTLMNADNTGHVGLLYGLNTLGAVLGVLAAGFFLIATLGVNQTIWIAGGISLAVGGIALYINYKLKITKNK